MAIIRPETEMKDSGVQWLGNVPKEWSVGKVKHEFYATKTIVGDKVNDYERLALTLNGVIKRSKDAGDGLQPEKFDGYQILKEHELVFKLIDLANVSTSRVGLSPYTGIVSPAYIVLHHRKDMNPRYGEYYFLSMWMNEVFNHIGGDGVRSALNAKDLLDIPYLKVAPDEQQAIADYLDETCSKIDEIIAEAKASIDEYKELRIAAVNDAVTHGIYNNAIKDSNVDWIGKIPDNWKIIITKRLFKIKKDIAGKEGYTVLSITQKGIVPKVFGGKGQFAADYSNYQLVNKGDFAMNHMDLLTGWLDISEYDGVTSPDYRVFVPTGYENIYTPYYKYVMQNCYSCRIYYGLGHGVAGMGRWRLPADMFLNFKLPMPPKAEQKEIADFLDKRTAEIDSLISEKESLINDLEAYKKSLIYEVVTGKRRVV
uniref:restriction endonuclease subunit S n=1 Tax=Anaerobutyricum hallii TaxID=39488 RepID=UPI003FEE3DD9